MSIATKRKYVTKEVIEEYVLPDDKKSIVKVLAGKGNNLHEVETASGDVFLASMPTKFRRNVWIKRGDYVMIETIEEGDKVKAEIVHILYKDQVKYIKDEGLWPAAFGEETKPDDAQMIPDDMLPPSDSGEDSDEELEDLVVCNPNRPPVVYQDSDEESEDSDNGAEETAKVSDCNEVVNR